jgi:hypothetical protein
MVARLARGFTEVTVRIIYIIYLAFAYQEDSLLIFIASFILDRTIHARSLELTLFGPTVHYCQWVPKCGAPFTRARPRFKLQASSFMLHPSPGEVTA